MKRLEFDESPPQPSILLANLCGIAASVLFGASAVAARSLAPHIPPLTLGVLRFGIGGLFLLLWFSLRHKRQPITRRDLFRFLKLGIVMFAAFPFAFNSGLALVEASRASLILASMPIWSALLGIPFGTDRLSPKRWVGVILCFVGIAVAFFPSLDFRAGSDGLNGELLMLAAAVLGASYSMLAKRSLERHDATLVASAAMLLGTMVLLPLALKESHISPLIALEQPSVQAGVLFLALPGGALAFGLWAFSLTHLSPTRTTVYMTLNPLAAAILALFLLGEALTPLFFVGLILVSAAIFLVNSPSEERDLRFLL